MQIVFAASECVPFAKSGGLADVVGTLPKEILKLGHEATVYLPLYAIVRAKLTGELKYAVRSITIPFPHGNRFVGVVDGGARDGVKFYFIDCPEMFDRQGFTEAMATATGTMPSALAFSAGQCWSRQNFSACRTFSTCTTGRPR